MVRKNVLHLIDTDKLCGPGKTIIESARNLSNSEFNLSVAAYNYNSDRKNAYLDIVKEQGFDHILLPTRGQIDPLVIYRLGKTLKSKNIHILHTHGYKSDLFGLMAGRLNGTKMVSTVHGWIQNNSRARFYVNMNKRTLRRFDKVITVSNKIKGELELSGVENRKLITVHNAINLSRYTPGSGKPVLRGEYGKAENGILMGVIGRLSPEKGQDLVLEAMSLLQEEYQNLFCFYIGDGPDLERLKGLARAKGIADRAFFTGHRSDMLDVYRSLDMLIIPSYTEGLPNVALEAMALNIPVIATKVGGVPEIVIHDETGYLIDAGNHTQISDAIRFLLTNPEKREQYIKSARERVEKEFSFEERMEEIKKIYHELF